MLRLQCEVKQYDWGQKGNESVVADLAACGDGQVEVDPAAPYAELWMGAHVSGPSRTSLSKEPLTTWLSRHPKALGKEVHLRHGVNLPFLFKVLSVRKSLSIQSHPDKSLAEKLHAERPNIYKDPNHKPEIALAVQGFEALCGFCSMEEINEQLLDKPELFKCVGERQAQALKASVGASSAEQCRAALKDAFTALMMCPENVYSEASWALNQRLLNTCSSDRQEKDNLFLRIFSEYPGDVGTLAVFFLNYVKLQPGQAIYLSANEPHAYLAGDLIEAMANSDNVIRAGLTPKLRDTKVLCESLTYNQGRPHMLCGQQVSECIHKYQPPFDEFQVLSVSVEKEGAVAIPAQKSPMVLMCLSCRGTHSLVSCASPIQDDCLQDMVSVQKGTVLFIPANTEMKLHSVASNEECSLLAYAATANDRMFRPCATEDSLPTPTPDMIHRTSPIPDVHLPRAIVAEK